MLSGYIALITVNMLHMLQGFFMTTVNILHLWGLDTLHILLCKRGCVACIGVNLRLSIGRKQSQLLALLN